jgi:hypothetical protein
MVKTRAKKRTNIAASRTAAATKIQKFIRKRIRHRLPVRPRPVIHHNPIANQTLLRLVSRFLSPNNIRSLANATRTPSHFEVQAMQNANVNRRRREAAEVARGRLPKIGPKPNYSHQLRLIRMIDTARAYVAVDDELRRNAPNLNRRLGLLRNDILRHLNHTNTSMSHRHNLPNNKWSYVNAINNNNRYIFVKRVLEKNNNNQGNWRGGGVSFNRFTQNGRNFEAYEYHNR